MRGNLPRISAGIVTVSLSPRTRILGMLCAFRNSALDIVFEIDECARSGRSVGRVWGRFTARDERPLPSSEGDRLPSTPARIHAIVSLLRKARAVSSSSMTHSPRGEGRKPCRRYVREIRNRGSLSKFIDHAAASACGQAPRPFPEGGWRAIDFRS
jgi:hypothetical protein